MKYNSTLPSSLFLYYPPLPHTTKVWIREVPCNPSLFITKSVPDWIGGMRSRKCQWSCVNILYNVLPIYFTLLHYSI